MSIILSIIGEIYDKQLDNLDKSYITLIEQSDFKSSGLTCITCVSNSVINYNAYINSCEI